MASNSMDRRRLVTTLVALPLSGVSARPAATAGTRLTPSGPVTSRADMEVIENLDILATSGDAVTVTHSGVTIRNCRIRHADGHGVYAEGATALTLHDLEVEHIGAPASGRGQGIDRNNLCLVGCPGATVRRVKASRGASNIYAVKSEGLRLSALELHDARGPEPRGQNLQVAHSPDSIVENFSAENGKTSWTEDNVSVFRSDRCHLRNGLVSYNNSPTGDGVMIEGGSDCIVEDVDAVQQGNGAFAAVPQGDAASGGCSFIRCRTGWSYNSGRDGRPPPSSNGLSFYMRISAGAEKHRIVDCICYRVANPHNLIWDPHAVSDGTSLTRRPFTARAPLRLNFGW